MQRQSFACSARSDARLLILGSMPGEASLRAQQYYAHPRNLFWTFIQELLAIDRALPYPQRLQALHACGIALWDVLQFCERPGSLDGRIVRGSEVLNDFAGFRQQHPQLRRIVLNGGTAAALFERHRRRQDFASGLEVIALPSTSPANAGQSRDSKLAQWRAALAVPSAPVDNAQPRPKQKNPK